MGNRRRRCCRMPPLAPGGCRRALGLLVGQIPAHSASRGQHARDIPHAGIPHTPEKKSNNNPIANLSYSLQGFAVTSAPRLEPRPPPGPISQLCFKRHLLKTHRLHGHHRLPATILTIFYEKRTNFTAVLFIRNTRTY